MVYSDITQMETRSFWEILREHTITNLIGNISYCIDMLFLVLFFSVEMVIEYRAKKKKNLFVSH